MATDRTDAEGNGKEEQQELSNPWNLCSSVQSVVEVFVLVLVLVLASSQQLAASSFFWISTFRTGNAQKSQAKVTLEPLS